jgi:hypothetical protein
VPLIATLALGLAVLGCSRSSDDPPPTRSSTTEAEAAPRLCSMLELALEHAGPRHRSFADLVENDRRDDEAVGAMMTLAMLAEPGAAGRFAPVIEFLARRSEVVRDPGSEEGDVPDPTAAVLRNARDLDRHLADGGCG